MNFLVRVLILVAAKLLKDSGFSAGVVRGGYSILSEFQAANNKNHESSPITHNYLYFCPLDGKSASI
jgi:hypothetical protein